MLSHNSQSINVCQKAARWRRSENSVARMDRKKEEPTDINYIESEFEYTLNMAWQLANKLYIHGLQIKKVKGKEGKFSSMYLP